MVKLTDETLSAANHEVKHKAAMSKARDTVNMLLRGVCKTGTHSTEHNIRMYEQQPPS